MGIVEFLTAQYDELQRMATDRLCIVCGHPVKERYVTDFGIREWRGYEHDERRDSTGRMHRWQGVRCEGGMTGAEPVQRPDLVLADIAAKRERLRLYLIARNRYEDVTRDPSEARSELDAGDAIGRWGMAQRMIATDLASYAARPGYDPTWAVEPA